jgi:hypothetical protein
MSEPSALHRELADLMGEQVVVDVKSNHVYIGHLAAIGADVIELENADVHYCGDSETTSELYLVEAKKSGVRPNRSTVYVMRSEVVSISTLDDVMTY